MTQIHAGKNNPSQERTASQGRDRPASSPAHGDVAPYPAGSEPNAVLALQHAVGNHAVGALLRSGAPSSVDPLGGTVVAPEIAAALQRLRGQGRSLPGEVAGPFEAQLGADLSGVRVHADPQADRLARSVQATAFTYGSDIIFSQGAYAPTSDAGKHLLAHELAHVTRPSSASAGAPVIGRADDPAERDADRVATRLVEGLHRSAHPVPSPSTAGAGHGRVARSAQTGTIRRGRVQELGWRFEQFQKTGVLPPAPTSGGASALGPRATRHRAWLVSQLKDVYVDETTSQRPDLVDVVRQTAAVIGALWNTMQALETVAPGDTSALDAAKQRLKFSFTNQKGQVVNNSALLFDQLKGFARDELKANVVSIHTRQFEKAKRQALPISEDGTINDAALNARLVAYDQTPEAQAKTLVLVGNKKLHRNDVAKSAVDTTESVTQHSGVGVEIFVVGAMGDIHMASHKIGQYHHSSLLAGANVAVGGEMKVTGGTINWISNKSGHYHPSKAQFIQFLHFLQKDYGDLSSVEIKAGFTDIKDGTKADKVLAGQKKDTGKADVKETYSWLKTQLALRGYAAEMGTIAENTTVKEALATLGYTVKKGKVTDVHGKEVPLEEALKELRRQLKLATGQRTNVEARKAGNHAGWERTL